MRCLEPDDRSGNAAELSDLRSSQGWANFILPLLCNNAPRGGERVYLTAACASAVSVYCWKRTTFPSRRVQTCANGAVKRLPVAV